MFFINDGRSGMKHFIVYISRFYQEEIKKKLENK